MQVFTLIRQHVLRESWEANTKSKESVVSYVLTICDKLDSMYILSGDRKHAASTKDTEGMV